MSDGRHDGVVTGALVGTTTVGFASFAHASSGGTIGIGTTVLASALVLALSMAVASNLPMTFWRGLLLSLAAQPLLHVAFEHGAHPDHSIHHGGARHHVDVVATGGTDPRMLAAHMSLAVVSAVAVRWGLLWLRSMPALARDLVVVQRRIIAPVPMRAGVVLALARVDAPARTVGRRWDSRGPPE